MTQLGSRGAIVPTPGLPGSVLMFNDRNIVFSANNKTHWIRIGGIELPLTPLIEIRMNRNWVTTEIAGSASNPQLSGTQVKENMGRSDASITITGFLMSTGATMAQYLRIQGGAEARDNVHWADKLKSIVALFKEETAVEITDWLPMEYADNDFFKLFSSADRTPGRLRVRDEGKGVFEELGIKKVVLLSFDLNEISGTDRRGYILRLQEDRDITLEDLTPTEENESGPMV